MNKSIDKFNSFVEENFADINNYESEDKFSSEFEGKIDSPDNYLSVIPKRINILGKFKDISESIKDSNVKEQLQNFNNTILNYITLNLSELKTSLQYLPPLYYDLNEDGSVLVTWSLKNLRIGFSFESNKENSNWYCILKLDDIERVDSGALNESNINSIFKYVLEILLRYV